MKKKVAKILSDKDIRRLLKCAIVDGDEGLVNPNGIELRLGRDVRFLSTGEDRKLEAGHYLSVSPGETVLISSLERLDFSKKTVQAEFPAGSLMGWISPTTTMMREGISQHTTKIDPGFYGYLNWSLRNNSNKDLVISFGEPIYKLTIFLLEEDETPDIHYGEKKEHCYQNTQGIVRSPRKIPADLPRDKVVGSSFHKLDPKKQLREAGYPFAHIATELVDLHGKFEVVSADVKLLKDQFEVQTKELSGKIEKEAASLSKKIDDNKQSLIDKFNEMFTSRSTKIVGTIVGTITTLYGILSFLQKTTLKMESIAAIAVAAGIAIVGFSFLITKKHS